MNQLWCIPTDCVSFLAAATSWDQLYINLGNKFLSDTTDKILTQIRDLFELDELIDKWRSIVFNLVERTLAFTPNINQDLLIANVSEKIFYDYRTIKKNLNQTYEDDINEVFNQYKYIISSRTASGDIPDQCVQEIVCSMEQFKNRLLVRTGKKVMIQENMMDQILKLNKNRFEENGLNTEKLNLVKDESNQMINHLLNNPEFNRLNADKKANFIQANIEKMILDKYDNDPNVQNIIDKTRSASLPLIRSQIENLKESSSHQQEQMDSLKSDSNLSTTTSSSDQSSSYDTTPSITKYTSDRKTQHKQRSHDFNRQTFIPSSDCPDYNPYRNYAKYKEKRLHNEKNVF